MSLHYVMGITPKGYIKAVPVTKKGYWEKEVPWMTFDQSLLHVFSSNGVYDLAFEEKVESIAEDNDSPLLKKVTSKNHIVGAKLIYSVSSLMPK